VRLEANSHRSLRFRIVAGLRASQVRIRLQFAGKIDCIALPLPESMGFPCLPAAALKRLIDLGVHNWNLVHLSCLLSLKAAAG